MKVFVIPSWYPSASNPIYGTFVQEQIQMMCKESDELSFGVSLWGQGDEEFLLHATQPFSAITKVLNRPNKEFKHHKGQISHNFTPASTWTNKFQRGNLQGIINANRKNLRAYIKDHSRPDIIHVQASYPGAWVALELFNEFKIPYVISLRMSPFPFTQFLDTKGFLLPQIRKVLDNSSRLIATSESLQKRCVELGLENVEVVHNPVDLAFFNSKTRSVSDDKLTKLLAVGRLEDQKGFDILLEAFGLLNQNQLHLTIIGEGSKREGLQNQIDRLGLSNQVSLTGSGSREFVAQEMLKSNLYVLSSRHETFGNVLLEAMACGKPVVATECGGPESLVTPETGILCPTEDPEALASAIKQAVSKPWDTKKIRAHVEQNFSPSIFTKRMLALYQDVINNG